MQVGKFLENIKRADQNQALQGEFFLKINRCADQNKAAHIGWNKRAGGFSLKINKRVDQNKAVQGGFLKIEKIVHLLTTLKMNKCQRVSKVEKNEFGRFLIKLVTCKTKDKKCHQDQCHNSQQLNFNCILYCDQNFPEY